MPIFAHREGKGRTPVQRADFLRSDTEPWNVAAATPETQQEIRDYLEDLGASALALANQYVDPAVACEAYDDMAMRVHEDVSSGFYPLDIAILRQQYRELGYLSFSFTELASGGEEGYLVS
jgi:hypothetical protein